MSLEDRDCVCKSPDDCCLSEERQLDKSKRLQFEEDRYSFMKGLLLSADIHLVRQEGRFYIVKLTEGKEHQITPDLILDLWKSFDRDCLLCLVEVLTELDNRT